MRKYWVDHFFYLYFIIDFLDYSFGTKIFPHMMSFLLTKGIRQLVNGRVWALGISVTSANEDSTTMETTRVMEMTTGRMTKAETRGRRCHCPPPFSSINQWVTGQEMMRTSMVSAADKELIKSNTCFNLYTLEEETQWHQKPQDHLSFPGQAMSSLQSLHE